VYASAVLKNKIDILETREKTMANAWDWMHNSWKILCESLVPTRREDVMAAVIHDIIATVYKSS
jgi:hypothetical protein